MDGNEGYPGKLKISMPYELNDNNGFVITYHTTTDQSTVVNLIQYPLFNLHGEGNGTINDHYLVINADQYTPINAALYCTRAK
jgi:aldose 1-epimerase